MQKLITKATFCSGVLLVFDLELFSRELVLQYSCYETFEHEADIGIRGFGFSIEESFAFCAKAMFDLMREDIVAHSESEKVYIQAAGFDLESLLVAWLNELLTQADLYSIVFREFEIEISELQLIAHAWGEYFVSGMDQGIEVKGATLAEAKVEQIENYWMSQCIVDV